MSRAGSTTQDRVGGGRGPVEPPRRPPVPTVRARRRSRLSPGRRRVLRVVLGLLVLAIAAWVLVGSPVLAVRSVQVDGARTLLPGQVRETAGIVDGTPLLRVDVDAARARVARLPQV